MTRIQHSTNPDVFVGTPEEFGLATTGDFSCSPDQWIASYKGRELDLLCSTPEDAFAEAERYAREQAESRSSGKDNVVAVATDTNDLLDLPPPTAEAILSNLRCRNEGDFDAIREEWPEALEEVFVGTDPLRKPSK